MTGPKPSMHALWVQAGGGTPGYSRERYLDLLHEHGALLRPGDEGYEQAARSLPCGWPSRGQYVGALADRTPITVPLGDLRFVLMCVAEGGKTFADVDAAIAWLREQEAPAAPEVPS